MDSQRQREHYLCVSYTIPRAADSDISPVSLLEKAGDGREMAPHNVAVFPAFTAVCGKHGCYGLFSRAFVPSGPESLQMWEQYDDFIIMHRSLLWWGSAASAAPEWDISHQEHQTVVEARFNAPDLCGVFYSEAALPLSTHSIQGCHVVGAAGLRLSFM